MSFQIYKADFRGKNNNKIEMYKFLLLAILAICIQTEFLKCGFIPTSSYSTPEAWCKDSTGQVITSFAQFNSNINGLEALFCFINNGVNTAMIDLQTLTSTRPSIAATYLLRGIDIKNIPKKDIWQVCQSLKGTSIGFYASGGWTNSLGQDEICVFPDGSKISTWALYYISNGNPEYLGIRSRIRSPPLPIKLPYQGNLYLNTGVAPYAYDPSKPGMPDAGKLFLGGKKTGY
jgi:hypothetical protein